MTPPQSIADKLSEMFGVTIYGFGECYVEATTAASARWCAASECHAAGYGQGPVELIQRGVDVRKLPEIEADTVRDGMRGHYYRAPSLRNLLQEQVKP